MNWRALAGVFLGAVVLALAGWQGFNGGAAGAETTRQLRIIKVAASTDHPGGAFGGSVSAGVGPFTVELAPGAATSLPVLRTVGTDTVGIAESLWPPGWSLVGYALVPDPSGTANCPADVDYAGANVIPAGETPYLVCIKNDYSSLGESRHLLLGVVTSSVTHPGSDAVVQLSTGQNVVVLLEKDQSHSAQVEVAIPASMVRVTRVAVPVDWTSDRLAIVADPSGTRTCQLGMQNDYADIPEGAGRYLVCVEATYHPPDAPRSLGLGIDAGSAAHPGGSFEVVVGASTYSVTLPAGQPTSVTTVVTVPPPGTAAVSFRALSSGWRLLGYNLWGTTASASCASVPQVSPAGGTALSLPPGSRPFLLCVQAIYLPLRAYLPFVARDAQ